MIFPVFLEDFIKHIYEEEDTLFGYIDLLDRFDLKQQQTVTKVLLDTQKHSLREVATEHSEEDEMAGIREMIKSIMQQNIDHVMVRTLVHEMIAFDDELENHAKIENQILFPKAIQLEQNVFSQLDVVSKFN